MRWLKFPSMWCTRRKRRKRPGSLGRGKQSELKSRWLNTRWLLNGVVFRKQHKISYIYIYIHNHIIRFMKYIIVYIFCFVVYNFWDYSTPIVRDVHFLRQKMRIREVQSTHQTSHNSIIPVASCNLPTRAAYYCSLGHDLKHLTKLPQKQPSPRTHPRE